MAHDDATLIDADGAPPDACASNLGSALARLQALSQTVSAPRPLDELAPALLAHVRDALSADVASLLLRAPSGGGLELQAACGLPEHQVGSLVVPSDTGIIGRVVADARPLAVGRADDDPSTRHLRDAGAVSVLAAPLFADEDVVGVCAVGSRRADGFSGDDGTLLRLASDWIGVAMSRAALLRAEREARSSAEAAQGRLAFLAEASRILSGSLDLRTTLTSLARLVVPYLADWATINLVEDDGTIRRVGLAAANGGVEDVITRLRERPPFDPKHPHGVPLVIDTGTTVHWPAVDDAVLAEAAPDAAWADIVREAGCRSALMVPLEARGRTLGAIMLVRTTEGRPFSDADITVAEELGGRAGLAVDNARVYAEVRGAEEQNRQLAQTLQASLLPPHLPKMPGTELAAVYFPAGGGGDVGGDFYDVFHTRGSSWGVVMGDVRGKGAEAATVTALARYTLRTAAMTARRASGVLHVLNEVMVAEDAEEMFCTIAYAGLTPRRDGTLRVEISCGGHPLPLVLRDDGTVEPVGEPGTVLGLLPEVSLIDKRTTLRPGDALVLYTDGVTEARFTGEGDAPLELFGDERLAALLAGCRGLDAAAVAARIEQAVLDFSAGKPRDDIAIVVVRVPAAPTAR